MRFLILSILLCSTIQAVANPAYIRRFTGYWTGTYQITNLKGDILGEYKMEQNYYWTDDQLWGETAVQLPNGSIEVEFSNAVFDEKLLRSTVQSKGPQRDYLGWIAHNRIWWINAFNTDAQNYQIHSESLAPSANGFVISIDGYQWSRDPNKPNFMRITAELRRLNEDEKFQLFDY